jgi:hypothetical protein
MNLSWKLSWQSVRRFLRDLQNAYVDRLPNQ